MPSSKITTSVVARATGVHPNTVRLYEAWGFLAKAQRTPKGYRLFTEAHIDQMRLARLVMGGPWTGRAIRTSGIKIVLQAAHGDLGGALEMAYHHQVLIQAERAQAEAAAKLLKRWAQGMAADSTSHLLRIKDAAALLDLSSDVLRNWERNGLVVVPRDPANGYRLYGQVEIGRLRVIRMLLRAGYSSMAVLRMLTYLDQGQPGDLRQVLDTPSPDENVYSASDRWLTALAEQEECSVKMIELLEQMINKRV
jgi:DNA-binding transcriptional MerR regulator